MSLHNGDNRNLFLKLKSKLGLYHVVLTFPKSSPEKITLIVVETQQKPDNEKTDSKEEISYLTFFTSAALYWMKQLFIIKTIFVRKRCTCKNLFLGACSCWDSRNSLRELDQKFKFGGNNGCVNSYVEFLIRHFEVFRLYAILYDAAGAVGANSGKSPGY